MPKAANPTSTVAVAAVTSERLRRIHRRAPIEGGSRHAVTGSSASHRSTSVLRASADVYRASGFNASAFRQIASKAGATRGLSDRGRGISPAMIF